MELRQPPRPVPAERRGRLVRWLSVTQTVLLVAIAVWLVAGELRRGGPSDAAERRREVAARLQAAGAGEEAAALYATYLEDAGPPPAERARIAYSLASGYLERGRYERALRWFYEAESWDRGELAAELGPKIVHTLERLGRHHAAQAALASRSRPAGAAVQRPESDPIVARIGTRQIHRSDLERALDDLPPEIAVRFEGAAGREQFLRRYVADELLWRKASKLEFDDDPEVRRRHAEMLKQLAVARFVEKEVVDRIEVGAADLENYYAVHQEEYAIAGDDGEPPRTPPLEEVRQAVERDYRWLKLQEAYQGMVDSELAAEEVELFPERLIDVP